MDALDTDGAIECAHCGLRQRFEVDQWIPAVALAHAVGDLSGPWPEGRNPDPTIWIGDENPYARVGVDQTFVREELGVVTLEVAPGYPVCAACHDLLVVRVTRPGAVETTCPRCGVQAAYAVPEDLLRRFPGLVAVVAEDHRSDRPKARAQATGSVVVLSCPACGAALTVSGSQPLQTCRYCNTTCVVPHRSLCRALQTSPEPTVWWMLLDGVSDRRKQLTLPENRPARPVGKASKGALFGLSAARVPIGDAPGVYATPVVTGPNLPQWALNLVLGGGVLVVTFGLMLALGVLEWDASPAPGKPARRWAALMVPRAPTAPQQSSVDVRTSAIDLTLARGQRARLRVRGGAERYPLTVDGRPRGKVPNETMLRPGQHRATVQHPRRGLLEYGFSLKDGETLTIDVGG
jgi:hypothetical protein